MVLAHYRIPTASFVVVPGKEPSVDWARVLVSLPAYPLFAKPTSEGSGKGVGAWSKVEDRQGLGAVVDKLRAQFPGQDILLEPFLGGRNLSVSIVGSGVQSRVLGVLEFLWKKQWPDKAAKVDSALIALDFVLESTETKGHQDAIVYRILPEAADAQVKRACEVALDTWRLLNCRDAGRVDIRFDSDGQDAVPNVLEVTDPVHARLKDADGAR